MQRSARLFSTGKTGFLILQLEQNANKRHLNDQMPLCSCVSQCFACGPASTMCWAMLGYLVAKFSSNMAASLLAALS